MAQSKEKKVTPTKELETAKQPVKAEEQKKIAQPTQVKSMIHIDEFIEAIRPLCDLNEGKANGFRAFMQGNHYLGELNDFVPYLETYIGKDVN